MPVIAGRSDWLGNSRRQASGVATSTGSPVRAARATGRRRRARQPGVALGEPHRVAAGVDEDEERFRRSAE
jgi:hypothetical protein